MGNTSRKDILQLIDMTKDSIYCAAIDIVAATLYDILAYDIRFKSFKAMANDTPIDVFAEECVWVVKHKFETDFARMTEKQKMYVAEFSKGILVQEFTDNISDIEKEREWITNTGNLSNGYIVYLFLKLQDFDEKFTKNVGNIDFEKEFKYNLPEEVLENG